MPNYKGKRPGTRRIVIWWKGRPREWVVRGTKADGDEFEAKERLKLRVESGPSERRVAVTFFELCEEYAVHAEKHLKASTWKVRVFQIDSLTTYLGSMRCSGLNPGKVDAYKAARLKDKLQASSINNELRVLRAVLKWGREMGHDIPDLRWRRLPQRSSPRARAFTLEEISLIFETCRAKAPTLLPMLIFLLNTGCRQGEAVAAEWSWVDFETEMIRIPSNEHWQPKNGKPREVPMSDALRAMLASQPRTKPWVFPTIYGKQFHSFPKELWQRIMKEAKLSGGAHQLRHTFASHFLEATRDLFLLAQVLGHSHHRVTELYAHLLPGHLDRARNAVNLGPTMIAAVGHKRPKNAKRA